MKITCARITPMPRPLSSGQIDLMPEAWATFEDGQARLPFSYYPDEISFTPEEFIGLTGDQD